MAVRCSTLIILLAGVGATSFLWVGGEIARKPRVRRADEVPIAFWAWRNRMPSTMAVQRSFSVTKATTLFLHAGQIDIAEGAMLRIRPVSGDLPQTGEIHFVYNGTRRFLREVESLTPGSIAEIVADTYQADLVRSRSDGADVNGLQLDFDVPTRLLPLYAQMLKQLRKLLPANTKLSITGLATWTASSDLKGVLANIDFWVPQCYGNAIPTHINELVPISSRFEVGRTVEGARKLGKPFYAGLSAYGYAILYSKVGELIEIRGDMEPVLAAQNAGLELIETRRFDSDAQLGEIQYVYRANRDVVLDGLIIQPGETLIVDLSSAASLRASGRAVRENAGDQLLGICIFRLPAEDDATMLSVSEIAAALADAQTKVVTEITLNINSEGRLKLSMENRGSARAILADDALTVDLGVPPGSISGPTDLAGFTAYETLCGQITTANVRPCSPRRANILRLKAPYWRPGNTASALMNSGFIQLASIPALITTRVNDGRIEREILELRIQNSEN